MGKYVIDGIPEAKAGVQQFNVTFTVNDDCILIVKTEMMHDGTVKEITIPPQQHFGLSEQAVNQMIADNNFERAGISFG